MRRFLIWIFVVTIAALLVALGVALGCALWSPVSATPMTVYTVDPNDPQAARLAREAAFPGAEFDQFGRISRSGFGWRFDHLIAVRSAYSASSDLNKNRLSRFAAGWPLFCLEGDRWLINNVPSERSLAILPQLPKVQRNGNGLGAIPLRPIWSGLLINALLYALPAYMIVATYWARRLRRIRRGLCLKCGYDLRAASGSNPICPECGTPRRQKTSSAFASR